MNVRLTRVKLVPLVLALVILGSIPAIAQELPPETPDPAGDTIDFGGNPADGTDLIGVTPVEVTEYEGFNAFELFEEIFDLAPAPGFIEIVPDEPGPLLSGRGPLILVSARLSRPLPDAQFCQVVIAFRTEGLEQYSGAAGDPNNGNDTTLDVFLQGGEWLAGRTEYRDNEFSFVSDYNEIAAQIGGDTIAIVFPRDAIPDGARWQIWVICGDDNISAGRDFTDLGSFVPGVIPTVSLIPPTTTTDADVETTTTAPDRTTTTPSTTVAPLAIDETADSGGSTVLLLVALSLALGAGLLWFLFFRKREGPCDCDMEKAAYDAAHASYASAESELSAARQLVDDWRGRESEARSAIVGLDALRPRRAEFTDQAAFDAAEAEYRGQRSELEAAAEGSSERLDRAQEMALVLEGRVAEQWEETQSWLAVVRACWQRCFDAPFEPPSVPTPPADGGGAGGEAADTGDGDDPRDTPPPAGAKPDCTEGQTREVSERTETFTVLVDGLVRVSITTDRGPLDDLDIDVTNNPFADLIAELLAPDGALELGPESLTGRNAQRWQDAVAELRALSYSVLKREIYVNVAFDVDDVTLECVRLEKCMGGTWANVGHRVDEKSRSARTVKHVWSESDSGGRPLGATMTLVNTQYQKASDAARKLSDFRSGCA